MTVSYLKKYGFAFSFLVLSSDFGRKNEGYILLITAIGDTFIEFFIRVS